MIWQAGDSSERLREALKTFIESRFAAAPYKARLPRGGAKIWMQGERQHPSLHIVLVTRPDEREPWVYSPGSGADAGRSIIEEFHQVALVAKADRKSSRNRPEIVSNAHNALKALFCAAMIEGTPERAQVLAAGLSNLDLDPGQGFELDGDDAGSGSFYEQRLNLLCSTDTFLN